MFLNNKIQSNKIIQKIYIKRKKNTKRHENWNKFLITSLSDNVCIRPNIMKDHKNIKIKVI